MEQWKQCNYSLLERTWVRIFGFKLFPPRNRAEQRTHSRQVAAPAGPGLEPQLSAPSLPALSFLYHCPLFFRGGGGGEVFANISLFLS